MINKKYIRLSKLSREFNVGKVTIIEFFASQNIYFEDTPNPQIPISYYKILLEEFLSDKKAKEESNLKGKELFKRKVDDEGVSSILYLGVKKIIRIARSSNILISKNFEERISEEYILDSLFMKSGKVYFSHEFEDMLFKNIFLYRPMNTIFHYSSLLSTFSILNTKILRLTSVAGLNDRHELESLDNKTDKKNSYKSLNEKYLLSLTSNSLKDNLNMWRLYGDDGTGCMLGFEVDSEKIGNFFIGQIIYNNNIINAINKLIKSVLDKGFSLSFNSLPYWKSFIKSNDYNYEKEVRLLYANTDSISKEWYVNSSNLLNSYLQFNLQKIPLKLTEIWLGPCSFEPETLRLQMMKMIYEDEFLRKYNIEIIKSNITHYRSTKRN